MQVTPQIAALYLGQIVDVTWHINEKFAGITSGEVWHDSPMHSSHIARLEEDEISITPHLRRLESITEDEAKEVFSIIRGVSFEEYFFDILDENPNAIGYFWKEEVEIYRENGKILIGEPTASARRGWASSR